MKSARIIGGKLAAVTVGGSLIGGSGYSSAVIVGAGTGAIRIGGNVLGGAGAPSAYIQCGTIASITIGGSLLAGSGNNSARIVTDGDMGAVTIGGDVQGKAIFSGSIECRGKLAAVTIGGSLGGGSGRNSGWIFSQNDMGVVKIGHDFVGGSVNAGDPVLDRSGFIESTAGRIASVTIGGDVRAGTDNSTNVTGLLRNAAISAGNNIGSIVIEGSVAGSVGRNITRVTFTARGQASPTATADVAVGKLTIAERAERMSVLAGYASNILPLNGNAQIGPISIGGDLVASHLIAGVRVVSGFGDVFGGPDDFIIGNLPNSIARIASIVIGGVVLGSPASAGRFGIESHTIGSLTINGFAVPIVTPLSLSPLTGDDVTVREV